MCLFEIAQEVANRIIVGRKRIDVGHRANHDDFEHLPGPSSNCSTEPRRHDGILKLKYLCRCEMVQYLNRLVCVQADWDLEIDVIDEHPFAGKSTTLIEQADCEVADQRYLQVTDSVANLVERM